MTLFRFKNNEWFKGGIGFGVVGMQNRMEGKVLEVVWMEGGWIVNEHEDMLSSIMRCGFLRMDGRQKNHKG